MLLEARKSFDARQLSHENQILDSARFQQLLLLGAVNPTAYITIGLGQDSNLGRESAFLWAAVGLSLTVLKRLAQGSTPLKGNLTDMKKN